MDFIHSNLFWILFNSFIHVMFHSTHTLCNVVGGVLRHIHVWGKFPIGNVGPYLKLIIIFHIIRVKCKRIIGIFIVQIASTIPTILVVVWWSNVSLPNCWHAIVDIFVNTIVEIWASCLWNIMRPSYDLEGCTPSYILHIRSFMTYLLGGYLPCRKDYKVWYFLE